MIIATEAIVLHARRHGDSSRIVTLYTREHGKMGVVAKGARTTKSAFGSAMEPLSHIRCTVYHRTMKDLHTIAKAELVHPLRRLGTDLELLRSGLLMCEMVMKTQAQEQADQRVFDLLVVALHRLNDEDPATAYSVSVGFRCDLANCMGFGLPLGDPPPGAVVRIGLTDGVVRRDGEDGLRCSRSAYDALRASAAGNACAVSHADELEIESVLSLYFSHHLDTRVVSSVASALR